MSWNCCVCRKAVDGAGHALEYSCLNMTQDKVITGYWGLACDSCYQRAGKEPKSPLRRVLAAIAGSTHFPDSIRWAKKPAGRKK